MGLSSSKPQGPPPDPANTYSKRARRNAAAKRRKIAVGQQKLQQLGAEIARLENKILRDQKHVRQLEKVANNAARAKYNT